MELKKNMGSMDKTVRLVVAAVFLYLILFVGVSSVVAWILGILAVVFVVTSFVGFCPLYAPFKLSTKK